MQAVPRAPHGVLLVLVVVQITDKPDSTSTRHTDCTLARTNDGELLENRRRLFLDDAIGSRGVVVVVVVVSPQTERP